MLRLLTLWELIFQQMDEYFVQMLQQVEQNDSSTSTLNRRPSVLVSKIMSFATRC